MKNKDEYLKREFGRTYSIYDTNNYNSDFAKLDPIQQCQVIKTVWTIDFDAEDDEKLKNGSLKDKLTIQLWRGTGKKFAYLDVENFVESLFLFSELAVATLVFSIILGLIGIIGELILKWLLH